MKSILYTFLLQLTLLYTVNAQLNLVAENQTATTGSTISIPVHLNSNQSTNVLGFQFTMNWDDNLLEYQSISDFGISAWDAQSFGTPHLTTMNNTLVVTWEDYPNTVALTENTLLFNLNFNVKTNFTTGSTDVSFCTDCAMEFLNQNINDLNVSYQNAQVSITSLPIELLQFDAKVIKNNSIQLSWTTATETNNSHFEIEHSIDSKDWEILGKVTSSGTSIVKQHYQFSDSKPVKGQNFYRLKQVDLNGDYEYSTIEMVHIEKEIGSISWTNPVQNKLHISYEAIQTKDLAFDIYSSDGQLIERQVFTVLAGQNNLVWNIHHLANGVYWVKNTSENMIPFKVIKQ